MGRLTAKLLSLIKKNILVITIILLVFIGLNWESFLKPGIVAGNDFYNFQLIFLQFLKKSFLSGNLPFWNPLDGGGLPMSMFSPIFYPVNLLYLIFSNIKIYLTLFYLIHFIVSFAGVYFFSLYSGRSKNASIVAGIIFTLSGFFAIRTYLGHIDLIAASAWLPMSFLFVKLYFKINKFSYILALVPIIGLQILTGNLQIGYYSIIATGLYFLSYLLFEKNSHKSKIDLIKKVIIFGLVLLLGLGLVSFSWLPTQIAAHFTTRGLPLNFELVSAYSQPLDKILLMIFPTQFATIFSYEGINFIGLIPLILTTIALMYYSGKWEVWFFAFLIFITVVVAAGNDTPIFLLLFKTLPGFANMRAHVRSLILALFAVAILSGYGYDYSFRRIKDFLDKNKLPGSVSLTFYCLGSLLIVIPFFISPLQHNFINIYLISGGIFIICFNLLTAKIIKLNFIFLIFSLVLAANFFIFDWDYLHPVNYKIPSNSDREISQFINDYDQNQKYKVWHDIGFGNNYLPKVFNFSQFGIHESQVTGWNWLAESYMEFKGQRNLTFTDYATSPYTFDFDKLALQLFGVKYVVSLNPALEDSDLTLVKSFDISGNYGLETGTAYLYTFNNSYPLFYIQKETTLTKSLQPNSSLNNNTHISLDSYQPNKVKLTIVPNNQNSGNEYLVFNELYFPGWRAIVNGNEVPVEIINHGVRGVKIPEDKASVEFYFLPPLWNLSILLSIISALILVVLVITNKIKKNN